MLVYAMAAMSRGGSLNPWQYETAEIGLYDCIIKVRHAVCATAISMSLMAFITPPIQWCRAMRPYIIDRMFQHRVMSRESIDGNEEK
ncbi:MAG: hypothetical protein WAK96_09715 [Desulfobaccales bacterium]